MIKRTIEKQLAELLSYYPIVVLTGPRQSGKTTLLRSMFPQREYFNLENPSTLDAVKADPSSFLELHGSNVIIDEAQRFPELFSFIQASVDEQREKGRFILSGSQNILLSDAISQTLAGRAAYAELLPLTLQELSAAACLDEQASDRQGVAELFDNIFEGFYPGQRSEHIPPEVFFDQYLATYVERDVRTMKNIGNLAAFRGFVRILAGRIGQLLDYASLASDAGISPGTAKSWLSILEASYLIVILRPLHNNFGKRYIKSPKVYFLDTGLACRLLGIRHAEEIEGHYLKGNLFENFVIAEIHKERASQKLDVEMFFYRDAKKHEVDLILRDSSGESAVEIKSASGFSSSMLKGLDYWDGLLAEHQARDMAPVPQKAHRRFIVYAGKPETIGEIHLLPWTDLDKLLLIEKDKPGR
ncbi:MAG: ATP-binding protein [Coriobacteriales bacterium]|jgi:predicted AAA+ superfamily ATPase|nr:ATP-binding protein [Coriobacteriales bacterium]